MLHANASPLRTFVVLVLCLGFAAATHAAEFVNEATGLHFPDTLGAWTKTRASAFQDPAAGVSIAYKLSDGATATVFVYRGRYAKIPTGGDGPLVAGELAQALADVEQVWRAQGATVTTAQAATLAKDARFSGPLAVVAVQTIKARGREIASLSALTGYRDHLLKVRLTAEGRDPAWALASLQAFSQTLADHNAERLDPFFKPRPASTPARISTPVPRGEMRVSAKAAPDEPEPAAASETKD